MADKSKYEKQFKEAKKLHHAGVDGDKKAVKSANEKLMKLREMTPNHALIEAFYGSSMALLARDSVRLQEKEELALQGLEALNHAVAMDPNHKEIRFLRGNVCLRLPDMYFQTAQIAIEDFTFLFDCYLANHSYLTPQQLKEVLNKLSESYQNAGNISKANEVLQFLAKQSRDGDIK